MMDKYRALMHWLFGCDNSNETIKSIVLTGKITKEDIRSEDSGCAKIVEVNGDDASGFFVRLHSWDETKRHEIFNTLIGKEISVTIDIK